MLGRTYVRALVFERTGAETREDGFLAFEQQAHIFTITATVSSKVDIVTGKLSRRTYTISVIVFEDGERLCICLCKYLECF
jgi:hypothetical protein